jgi:hypothetical protein
MGAVSGEYVYATLSECPSFGGLGTPYLGCCDGTSHVCEVLVSASLIHCLDANQWAYCCTYPVSNIYDVPGGESLALRPKTCSLYLLHTFMLW